MELFAADGHDAGGCERVTGKSGMRPFQHHLRVYGTGRYSRDSEGQWEMRSFRISNFDELDDRPLAETVEHLRAVTRKVGLDQDIITKLAAFRHGSSPGERHNERRQLGQRR